jgi:hypothetical protein
MKNLKRPKCPTEFSLAFARRLVRYLGGDPSLIEDGDCWRKLVGKYPTLAEPAAKYFETAKEGNPSWAAVQLAYLRAISVGRAMRIIERAKTGDPSWAAYRMAHNCHAPIKRVMRIIERAKIGSPAEAADLLAFFGDVPEEWAEKVKERWQLKRRKRGEK